MSLGGTDLLRRQRQTLHIAEKAKRMLNAVSTIFCAVAAEIGLPKSNTQAPNGLHLVTGGLVGADPVAVNNLSSLVMNGTLELAVQFSRRLSNAVGADDLAVQVG